MKFTARLRAAAGAARQFARVVKFYAGVELPVRLGVAVIADGRCRLRWYGSDQAKVCERVQAAWWGGRRVLGVSYGSGKLTAFKYHAMREIVTGSNWQHKQYRKAAALAADRWMLKAHQLFEANMLGRGAK